MTPEDISMVRHCMADRIAFPYHADREAVWLLAHLMPETARIADLRASALGRFMNRPVTKAMVARCGDGVLHKADVMAVAQGASTSSPAALAGLEVIYALPWQDFELTLSQWGPFRYWGWGQTSRKGGNLVLQLAFPSDHAALMGRHIGKVTRKDLEYDGHPIRTDGRPTLAWARLDVDLETGTALIEEVQSDWLRNASDHVESLSLRSPRSRELRLAQSYEAGLRHLYGKVWSKAMLLAALVVLREQLGCREVWMHMPETGVKLKQIDWTAPPRSLYSTLPKGFAFEAVHDAPAFLRKPRRRALNLLEKSGKPIFWRMAL